MPRCAVILDKRDTLRVRKCWWVSSCCTVPVMDYRPKRDEKGKLVPEVDGKIVLEEDGIRERGYIEEVPEDEATKHGEGRKCPHCGRTVGSYICDGFPTHTAPEIVLKSSNKV